jgi:hypothetical protein
LHHGTAFVHGVAILRPSTLPPSFDPSHGLVLLNRALNVLHRIIVIIIVRHRLLHRLLPVRIGDDWVGVVYRDDVPTQALMDFYDITNKALLYDPSFAVDQLSMFEAPRYRRLRIVPDQSVRPQAQQQMHRFAQDVEAQQLLFQQQQAQWQQLQMQHAQALQQMPWPKFTPQQYNHQLAIFQQKEQQLWHKQQLQSLQQQQQQECAFTAALVQSAAANMAQWPSTPTISFADSVFDVLAFAQSINVGPAPLICDIAVSRPDAR